MSWVKAKAKPQYNLDDFKDVDEDAIIEELTEEELLELNAAIDPEVSCLDFGVCGGKCCVFHSCSLHFVYGEVYMIPNSVVFCLCVGEMCISHLKGKILT